MHELAVVESILSIALEEAKAIQASKITQIDLTIGKLSGMVPLCIQFHFDIISKRTIAAGAKLVFNQPPVKVRCRKCDTIFSPEGFDDLVCPNCKERKIEVLSGRECMVDLITMQ